MVSLALADPLSDAATLILSDVRLPLPDMRAGELILDFTVSAGELAIVATSDVHQVDLIIDAACGLLPPRAGTVCFQGRDWHDAPRDHANARRGRIGSAQGEGAWLPYLPMPDNILLPALFHTRRTREVLFAEAVRLATELGLLGLPTSLPPQCSVHERRRAALIRAFLGTPDLVLISPWAGDFGTEALGHLINTMRRARDAGAAIVWFVPEEQRELDIVLLDCRRYTLLGNRLVEDRAV